MLGAIHLVHRFEWADEKRQTAWVPSDLGVSAAELRQTYIYFGPQAVPGPVHAELLANVARFPKSRQSLRIVPEAFARLQQAAEAATPCTV